jgi:hypothetical protein
MQTRHILEAPIEEMFSMNRLVFAVSATVVLFGAYAISPLAAAAVAAAGAAVLMASLAIMLRNAERAEIAHVMEIIDACVAAEEHSAQPARMVS